MLRKILVCSSTPLVTLLTFLPSFTCTSLLDHLHALKIALSSQQQPQVNLFIILYFLLIHLMTHPGAYHISYCSWELTIIGGDNFDSCWTVHYLINGCGRISYPIPYQKKMVNNEWAYSVVTWVMNMCIFINTGITACTEPQVSVELHVTCFI